MQDKFTDRVRRVMFLAREEAGRLHHDYIGTEHLLLGVIREGEGLAATILTNLGLDLDMLKRTIENLIEDPMAEEILRGDYKDIAKVTVRFKEDHLYFDTTERTEEEKAEAEGKEKAEAVSGGDAEEG